MFSPVKTRIITWCGLKWDSSRKGLGTVVILWVPIKQTRGLLFSWIREKNQRETCHYSLWPVLLRTDVEDSALRSCCYAGFCRENLLPVVITDHKAWKTSSCLFLPSTSPGQSVFFPKQNCNPCKTQLCRKPCPGWGYEVSCASQAGTKLASHRARLPWGLQVKPIPRHQWVQGQRNLRATEDNDFNVIGNFFPSLPFYGKEVNPREKLKPCASLGQTNTLSGWTLACCPNVACSADRYFTDFQTTVYFSEARPLPLGLLPGSLNWDSTERRPWSDICVRMFVQTFIMHLSWVRHCAGWERYKNKQQSCESWQSWGCGRQQVTNNPGREGCAWAEQAT